MIVNCSDEQTSLQIHPNQVQAIVEQVLAEEGQHCDEINIYFVDTRTISQLHEDFFQDPSPTDCISFPLDSEEEDLAYRLLGEVFVCPETAIAYGAQHDINPYEETTLYIVHGLLHLMGYDDIEKLDAQEMSNTQTHHMQAIRKKNLLLSPVNDC